MSIYTKDFPFFSANPGLVYVDNAATTQKPACVIDALTKFYAQENCSIYRGVYPLAENVTQQYEDARKKTADFIGAQYANEIIFTANATASCNMVAQGWLAHVIQPGGEIVVTAADHFSNLLPWLVLAEQKNVHVHIIPVLRRVENKSTCFVLDYDYLEKVLSDKTRLVAIPSHTNVTGESIDCARIIDRAHKQNIPVLVDASQTMVHERISASNLDCDFLAFSPHKALGPMGLGVLFAKRKFHAQMKPFLYGGGMISQLGCKAGGCSSPKTGGGVIKLFGCDNCPCSFAGGACGHDHDSESACFSCVCSATHKPVPYAFEAGTPNVGGVIAWSAALDYLNAIDFSYVRAHEEKLCSMLLDALQQKPFSEKVRVFLPCTGARHLVSFVVEGMHTHDVAAALGQEGVCVRAGTHCAQLAHDALHVNHTVRVSFALYNTVADVERVIEALKKVVS